MTSDPDRRPATDHETAVREKLPPDQQPIDENADPGTPRSDGPDGKHADGKHEGASRRKDRREA